VSKKVKNNMEMRVHVKMKKNGLKGTKMVITMPTS